MPAFEFALPPGAKNIKIKTGTQEIAVEPTYYRHSKDGAIPIVALFGGDEFVGEVLEGQWLKGDDGNIQGPFTARINSGSLELTGKSDAVGTNRSGWIGSENKILFLDELTVDIHVKVDGKPSAEQFRHQVYFTSQEPNSNPYSSDFLCLQLRATTTSYQILIEKRVNNSSSFPLTWTDVTSNEGTWRIKFEENKAGHNHTHIYYHDGSGDVDETSDEVSGSPFQLGLAIDSAFCFLVLYTLTTENHTISSNFVRVTYPDFKVVYDLDDSDYQSGNRGEVVVWDTMGSNDENDWVRVFDPSHKFVGDCVIENGLIRVKKYSSSVIKAEYWNGSSWSEYSRWLIDWGDATFDHNIIRKITMECAVVDFVFVRSPYENVIARITVERGKNGFFWEEVGRDYDRVTYFNRRFGFYDGKVIDGVVDSDKTDNVNIDNFVLALDNASEYLPTLTLKKYENFYFDVDGNNFVRIYYFKDTQKVFLGVVPFSNYAKLFKEAEDATLGSGTTIDTTLDDDSGDSVVLDAALETVDYCFSGLPVGRYIAFVRAKDTNQITNDFALEVKNATEDKFLNEENTVTYHTLTSSFAYYGIVFDITEDEEGDTIRIRAMKQQSDANNIYVDYFLIVPIGNGESWPQDIAHNAMRTASVKYRVFRR